jgi:hypothetical protein
MFLKGINWGKVSGFKLFGVGFKLARYLVRA